MTIIEQIKARLTLEDVMLHFNVSPPQGKRLIRCPFHEEKTGSFQAKGDYFRCYGCGVHGDLLTFTALALGGSVADMNPAITYWARHFNTTSTSRPDPARITAKEKKKIQARCQEAREQLMIAAEAGITAPGAPELMTMHNALMVLKDEIDLRHIDLEDPAGLKAYDAELTRWRAYYRRMMQGHAEHLGVEVVA